MTDTAVNLSPEMLTAIAGRVEKVLGISFLPDRLADLRVGLQRAAATAGEDLVDFARAVLADTAGPALAPFLTVPETSFFRDPATWQVIENDVLGPLIARRRETMPFLRLWSAGCCTGEEAYSLATVVDRLLPERQGWNISILATDINEDALARARRGVYRAWSFRNCPPWLREGYFTPAPGGCLELRADIRRMVRFRHLNLAGEDYPALATDTGDLDLVLCRNVLMYFTPEGAARVAERLTRALAPDGCLIVGSAESSRGLFPGLAPVASANCLRHCRRPAAAAVPEPPTPAPPRRRPARTAAKRRRPNPVPPAPAVPPTPAAPDAAATARELADRGDVERALVLIRRAAAAAPTVPDHHLFEAVVLQQLDRPTEALAALRRCLYLAPETIMAHYLMATIELRRGRHEAARRALANVRRLLADLADDDPVPAAADGLAVGTLKGMLRPLEGVLA